MAKVAKGKNDLSVVQSGDLNPFEELFLERWNQIGAPIRPSEEECRLYEEYIRKAAGNHKSKLLILGATPELRDLALHHSLKPVCCYHDIRVWQAMMFFMKHSGEEKFIHLNWLEMSEKDRCDIVLGYYSLNMLPRDSIKPFIEKTANLTKKGGLYIQRIGTSNEK